MSNFENYRLQYARLSDPYCFSSIDVLLIMKHHFENGSMLQLHAVCDDDVEYTDKMDERLCEKSTSISQVEEKHQKLIEWNLLPIILRIYFLETTTIYI